MEAQRKGKEEGKGFFSRWADQLKATATYSDRYWNIPPDEALRENPGNFAIPNPAISLVKIKRKSRSAGGQETEQTYTEVNVKKETYYIDGYSRNVVDMLKAIFGDRVKT